MSLAILGMGTALPHHRIDQTEAADLAMRICCKTPDQAALVPSLYRQSGIKTRHLAVPHGLADELARSAENDRARSSSADTQSDLGPGTEYRMGLYRDHAQPLAIRAAGCALLQSGVSPGEITHLITVSCTGFSAPGVDIGLITNLGLPPTVQRIHVGFMGCHGAINGLRAARAFCDAEPDARVLLCAVELCSIHFHFGWDPKRVVANALFADGAAALVGSSGDTSGQSWRVAATGSYLFPDSEKAMTWRIGDHGFEMTLAARVPGLIKEHLRHWLERWLAEHGAKLEAIASWAIHPGGPRILSDVETALELGDDATLVSRELLAECGNMSSPTVLFILDRLGRRCAPLPCVALGFGPGLMAEAALLV
jgi:predicted naringenin-chalcone synthase